MLSVCFMILSKMDNSLIYKIAITKIPKVGNIHAKNLISFCGGVAAVFETSKKALLKIPGIGAGVADAIIKQDVLKIAEQELNFIEKHQVQTYFYLDKNYPNRLKHYPDCPIMLFGKGNMDFNHPRNVAIVGTRKPTPRGKLICEELVEGLQDYGVQIVSGLAYGIDIAAHRKCVQLGMPTIGIMGSGLSQIYPAIHYVTAMEMLENGGLLTEFTSELGPDYHHFPLRNRIIAGLSDALIVVETANKGGSMISAKIANAYNKDVFAVPGRMNDKTSAGCNHLIKIHKANLIESAKDVSYIMRWDKLDQQKNVQKQFFVELTPQEQAIVKVLENTDSKGIDQLSYDTQLHPSEMAGILLELEFKGMIQPLPGKRYMLV